MTVTTASNLIIRPKLCETDLHGHVNNTSVGPWLEEGRLDLFRRCAGLTYPTALVYLEMNYRAEIQYDTEVEVITQITHVGTSSIKYKQEIVQNKKLCLDANAVCAKFNAETRKSEAWSAADQAILKPFVVK